MGFPIDIVYTWVNGSDPAFSELKRHYLKSHEENVSPKDFRDYNTIFYSIRSINKFAPWVRQIWVLTNGQTPPYIESDIPVKIIRHEDFFKDPSHLPTFNSQSIESQFGNISGLAEHFIYFNDDMLLGKPVTPDLFFPEENKILIRGKHTKLPSYFIPLWYTQKTYSGAYDTQLFRSAKMAVSLLGFSKVRKMGTFFRELLYPQHQAYACLKSVFEELWAIENVSKAWMQNLYSKFRSDKDLQSIYLVQLYALGTNRAEVTFEQDQCYLELHIDSDVFQSKIEALQKLPTQFICVNDGKAHIEDRNIRALDVFLKAHLK